MASRLDLLRMVPVHLARQVHLLRVQPLFVAACHPRRRLTMWPQVHTTLSHRSLHHSLLLLSSHRHPPTRLNSPSSPIVFPIRTMVHMRPRVAFHPHRLRRLLVWPARLVKRPRALSHPLVDVPAVHHQRCDLLSKIALALPATGIRAPTRHSTMLIPPLAVASQVVRLRLRQLLRQQRQQRGIVRIVPLLRHRSVIGSGRRVPSCRATMRSARSSKSLTADVLRLHITCRRHRSRARVPRPLPTPDVLTMAITPQRLLITRPHWHQLALLKRRHRCLACRRHRYPRKRRPVPNITSQPLVTLMSTRTTMTRVMSQRRTALSLSATALALHRPTACPLRPPLLRSRSLRKSLSASSTCSLRDHDSQKLIH